MLGVRARARRRRGVNYAASRASARLAVSRLSAFRIVESCGFGRLTFACVEAFTVAKPRKPMMKNAAQPAGPDELLTGLDARILDAVEGTLSNDESSTDTELARYMIGIGLSGAQAQRAVSYRDLYRLHLWVAGCTPIRSGVRLQYNG